MDGCREKSTNNNVSFISSLLKVKPEHGYTGEINTNQNIKSTTNKVAAEIDKTDDIAVMQYNDKVRYYLKHLQDNVQKESQHKEEKFQLRAGGGGKQCADACCGNSDRFDINCLYGPVVEKQDSSVLIIFGKKKFFIERMILIQHSVYFKTHPDISKNIPIKLTLKLNPKAWQLVYVWLTSQNGIVLDANNVISVYTAAKQLQIQKLVNQCLQFVAKYFSDITNDVMLMMQEIQSVGEEELIQLAHHTLVKQGENLLKSCHFLQYNVEQVCRILCDDLLAIKSEKQVFDATMSWLMHKWPERSVSVTQVVSCVRFGRLSEHELLLCLSNDIAKYYVDIPECQEMVLEGFQYLAAVDIGYEMLVSHITPKERKGGLPKSEKDSVSAVGSDWSLECKDPDIHFKEKSTLCVSHNINSSESPTSEENDLQSPSTSFQEANMAAAKIQNFYRRYKARRTQKNSQVYSNIFQINGPSVLMFAHNCDLNKDVILCYNIRDDKWKEVLIVNHQLESYAAALMEHKIYITGGILRIRFKTPIVVNTAKYLDLHTAQWQDISNLQTPRFDHSLVVCSKKLFAIGGYGPREICLSSVECYDPNEDKWTVVTSIPTARAGAAVVNCCEHLWVCGGVLQERNKEDCTKAIDNVDCYDVLRNYWYKQLSLPVPLGYSLGLVFRGNIFLIGGASAFLNVPQYADGSLNNRMFMFDIVKENWSELERSIRPRLNATGTVIGDYLFVFGGYDSPQSAECFSWKRKKWVKISKCPHLVTGANCFFILPKHKM